MGKLTVKQIKPVNSVSSQTSYSSQNRQIVRKAVLFAGLLVAAANAALPASALQASPSPFSNEPNKWQKCFAPDARCMWGIASAACIVCMVLMSGIVLTLAKSHREHKEKRERKESSKLVQIAAARRVAAAYADPFTDERGLVSSPSVASSMSTVSGAAGNT
jgi:hypothetical protein